MSISVKNISRSFGDFKAVNDVSIDVESGELIALLGPSGSGKTTLLRIIAGLETADSGQICFHGEDATDSSVGERRIGFVFQHYALFRHMTVFENIAFPLRVAKDRRYGREEVSSLVGQALATVGLSGYGDRPATRLSGGQQQRVALARAIVHRPKLLLLDEPLSNLDAALREDMRTELRRLQQQIGVTTIYVTHDQSEALAMSDRIAVMDKGRIVQMGDPRDIYFRPANAFVANFIGAANLLHGKSEDAVAAGGIGSVRLPNGSLVACLFPSGAAKGTDTTVSLRPESIVVGAETNAGLNGTIVSSSFLGSSVRYEVRIGDDVIRAMAAGESTLSVGSPVSLTFPPTAAVVLG